ncbi:kinase-like domain-containing protein [Globomyces pollinis-pini]|nr:kinase-like domain-containing protein [Globomyces pollinis-pini]
MSLSIHEISLSSQLMRKNTVEAYEPGEELSLRRFELLTIIGQGAFGKVRLVTEKISKKQYALKYMEKRSIVRGKSTTHVFRERMILQSMQHPYIIGLRYAFQDDDYLFMVLELAKGGDLRFHLSGKRKSIDDFTIQLYTAEIASGLAYMHSYRIVHRDLKPENILLDKDGHIFITDFNIAVCLDERIPKSESGTLDYMAPEMLLGIPYTYSVDWWATGTILYEMAYKKLPFSGGFSSKETKERIKTKPLQFPMKDSSYNEVRNSFIEGLLERETCNRLGSGNDGQGFETQIKCHKYFENIDWALVERKQLKPNYCIYHRHDGWWE